MTLPSVITIDGPAASGKSTIGHMLADHLGYLYLDTGIMYRAATLAALKCNVNPHNEEAVANLAREIDLDIRHLDDEVDGRQYTVILDGNDVTWDLRRPEIDANVSLISSYPKVREEMVRRQRLFGQRGRIVMIGRDIGTVVMPNAPLKFFITASPEVRAHRRSLDREAQGHHADPDQILAEVKKRDHLDSSRKHSPLRPAKDAIIIDTSLNPPESVLNELLSHINTEQLNNLERR